MASERSRLPGALPGIVAYGQALRALRLAAGRMGTGEARERPLLALERGDVVVYAVAALLCLLTALPFWLASADGVVAGPGGVPAPRLWDALGRASAMLSEGPWPPAAGYGPFSPLWTWALAVPP